MYVFLCRKYQYGSAHGHLSQTLRRHFSIQFFHFFFSFVRIDSSLSDLASIVRLNNSPLQFNHLLFVCSVLLHCLIANKLLIIKVTYFCFVLKVYSARKIEHKKRKEKKRKITDHVQREKQEISVTTSLVN